VANVILQHKEDSILTITLNQPELRNPISDLDVIDPLVEAFEVANADESVRVVILTGAGSAFSGGGNIKNMGLGGPLNDPAPARTRRNYKLGIQRLPVLFEAIDVPVIAAVNGPAIGAGCDLACMCDVRIAAESARFAESFVKIGLVSGDGGAWLLPRIVGFSKASEMILTGDAITAAEALACGLVSKVVPDADLMTAAKAMAARIAANPPHAVRLTKRLLREAYSSSLSATLEISAGMQAMVSATKDHQEGIAAMVGKRPPKFTGN
jgi:enoyl-CoA hydratase/carnithine racemase